MKTRRLVNGSHTRKTAAFVRACAAYCYITIPSVENILLKLNLYLLSGRVAISNGALSQGTCSVIDTVDCVAVYSSVLGVHSE